MQLDRGLVMGRGEGGWLMYLTTAVGSLFLAGLMPAGGAVCSRTPRSATLYRACGWRETAGREEEREETKVGKENEMAGL